MEFFFVKLFVYNLPIGTWSYYDFTLWTLFLSIPKFVAVYTAVAATHEAENLNNMIGKYANQCCDDWNSLKVC